MGRKSAGILMYRRSGSGLEVLLGHPGGPYWRRRDNGAWSIPKGEFTAEEAALDAARREFREETGFDVSGEFLALRPRRQKGGKLVIAFAVEGDCDPACACSNVFEMEWPRGSGKLQSFPELDRIEWFPLEEARQRMLPAQVPLLDELADLLAGAD